MRIFVQDQGLHNADIGQKDHLWMDANKFKNLLVQPIAP